MKNSQVNKYKAKFINLLTEQFSERIFYGVNIGVAQKKASDYAKANGLVTNKDSVTYVSTLATRIDEDTLIEHATIIKEFVKGDPEQSEETQD